VSGLNYEVKKRDFEFWILDFELSGRETSECYERESDQG
jgi:hypothetical protein